MVTAAVALGVEVRPLAHADGCSLAEPIRARIDIPRRDAAAMDGYALGADPVLGAPLRWEIVDTSTTVLSGGKAMRVATGAPLPGGAMCVLPIERAIVTDGWVESDGAALERSGIRARGSDLRSGAIALAAGCRIGPRALVAAAAADVATVVVRRRPRVGVLVRGAGLVAPGDAAASRDATPDVLGQALLSFAAVWGGRPGDSVRIGDDSDVFLTAVSAMRDRADVIVLVGGAAHGARDATKDALGPLGLQLGFDGLAIRPGRPTWYGRIGETHLLALPGNPTAAMTVARLLLAPLLLRLAGEDPAAALAWEPMPLLAPVVSTGAREAFLCATAEAGGVRVLDRGYDTAGQMMLASADRLVARPAHGPALPVGASVPCLRF